MPTSVLIDGPPRAEGSASRMKALLLHVFCGALALYPLLEQFIAPVLAGAFLLVAADAGFGLIARRLAVRRSFVWTVWALLTTVYVTWSCIALVRGNVSQYIVQDSFGFLLYLGVLPVLYLYIVQNRLEAAFIRFVDLCAMAISVASVALLAGFLILFGSVDSDSLLFINAFLAGLGLSWKVDHNAGLIGLYTNTGHLLLLGSALAMYRFAQTGKRVHAWLLVLYVIAIVLDGHRALVIAILLQLLMVAPRLLARLTARQRLQLLGTSVVALALVVGTNLEWIQQRFEFSDNDVSSAERYAQVPALIDKIEENPVLGGGFGTVAAYIRSVDRPFSYEVDFLATMMKLGVVGSLIYFGAYLYGISRALKTPGGQGIFLLSAGLSFFFYMGTNGNQAMSTDSAVFHILLFLLIVSASAGSGVQTPRQALVESP